MFIFPAADWMRFLMGRSGYVEYRWAEVAGFLTPIAEPVAFANMEKTLLLPGFKIDVDGCSSTNNMSFKRLRGSSSSVLNRFCGVKRPCALILDSLSFSASLAALSAI